mgnify:CR=1 FL=1
MLGSSFSVKRIINTQDKDYIKSLSVYNRSTPVCIKTNSNEITYWIDNKNDKFQSYVFSLFIKNINVGFAMTSFLKRKKILIIDYLALDEKYKNNTVFLSFFTLIQLYFNEFKLDINYIMVEISNKNNGTDIDKESQLFLKFLCLEDFYKINYEYTSLPLGINNTESCFNAFLYIKSADKQHSINKETFLSFVDCLYTDYYLEWYKPFFDLEKITAYQNNISECIHNLEDSIPDNSFITLDFSCCREIDPEDNFSVNNNIPLNKHKSKNFYIFLFIILLLSPIPIIWGYNFVLEKLGIHITSVNAILGAVISTIFTAIITIFIGKKHL